MRPRARRPSVCETSGGGPGSCDSDRVEFIRGADCRDVLPLLPPAVFDACITDAPYGLGLFAWDRDVPGAEVWTEVLRVMKPGAVLAAFAGRRTYHRLATSAGQEDQLVGRPKMLPGGRPTREVHPDRLIDHPEAGVLHRGG